ncbi:hypothetical protein HKX48_005863 [Thoreauomyces humboldtii]|nr:hypothetical protein HKX48_005863 [Thoreauomyces humboldtii]
MSARSGSPTGSARSERSVRSARSARSARGERGERAEPSGGDGGERGERAARNGAERGEDAERTSRRQQRHRSRSRDTRASSRGSERQPSRFARTPLATPLGTPLGTPVERIVTPLDIEDNHAGPTGMDYFSLQPTPEPFSSSEHLEPEPEQEWQPEDYRFAQPELPDTMTFYEDVAAPQSAPLNPLQLPKPTMSRAGSYNSLPDARHLASRAHPNNVAYAAGDAYGRIPEQFPLHQSHSFNGLNSYNSPAVSPGNSAPSTPGQTRRAPRAQRVQTNFIIRNNSEDSTRGMRRMGSETPLLLAGNDSTDTLYVEPGPAKVRDPPKKYPPASTTAAVPLVKGTRKSYQVRALGRKALSFQRRQWFTNVCCIAMCPLLMVVVSALVGMIITNLIKNQTSGFDLVYCSNLISINEQAWPITNLDAAGITTTPAGQIPGTTRTTRHANFYSMLLLATASGDIQQLTQLTLQALLPNVPCVSWFGEGYPMNDTDVYAHSQSKKTHAYANKDSGYINEVKTGWLDIFRADILADPLQEAQAVSLGGQFAQYQMRPWALVGMDPSVSAAEVGTAPQQPAGTALSDIPLSIAGSPSTSMFKPGNTANGLLDTIEPRWFVDVDIAAIKLKSVQQVPYFQVSTTQSPTDLNTQLIASLETVLQNLTTVDDSIVFASSRTSEDIATFLGTVNEALADMPYGSIYFTEVSHNTKTYNYTLAFGSDSRLATSAIFPTAGKRQVLQMSQLSNAILRRGNADLTTASITQGTRMFPTTTSGGIGISVSGPIGRVLYPFALSFLLPVFVLIMVREKEDRVLMMMRMNGMKSPVYYASQYITFFVLYCISALIFLAAGYATRLDMFVKTDISVLIIVLLLWGAVQVAMALFFAAFFDRGQNALLITFFVVLCGIIVSVAANQTYDFLPWEFYIWPPFAFYRCLSVMNQAAFTRGAVPYTISRLKSGDEVYTAVLFMVFETIIVLGLAVYVRHVLPAEYGVRKKWHFPITQPLGWTSKSSASPPPSSKPSTSSVTVPNAREDDDVRAERLRVQSNAHSTSCPLVIKNLHKAYPPRHGLGSKVALEDITLALDASQVFGLLGQNGAGKTTLISILTGLYTPTRGTASIAGYDVTSQIDEIYKLIGVCPQFDLLWGELSVLDHVLFYARLKGVSSGDEDRVVKKILGDVKLGEFGKRLVKGLSGGEKRRLSIAIALVGDPLLVFMDEPTTGLDPEVRRLIWDVIDRARIGRTIILTTHSMEEAETCCQRLGIMAHGTLTCIGPQLRLKKLYGSGYKLALTTRSASSLRRAATFLETEVLHNVWFRRVQSRGTIKSAKDKSVVQQQARGPGPVSQVWVFVPEPGLLATLMRVVEKIDGVIDWGLTQRGMDDVFLNVVGAGDEGP